MKRKVGTLLEEETYKMAKHRAFEEGRPLSDIIQEAVSGYLGGPGANHQKREKAYEIFCERPLRITQKQFREILDEDAWDR